MVTLLKEGPLHQGFVRRIRILTVNLCANSLGKDVQKTFTDEKQQKKCFKKVQCLSVFKCFIKLSLTEHLKKKKTCKCHVIALVKNCYLRMNYRTLRDHFKMVHDCLDSAA